MSLFALILQQRRPFLLVTAFLAKHRENHVLKLLYLLPQISVLTKQVDVGVVSERQRLTTLGDQLGLQWELLVKVYLWYGRRMMVLVVI